MRRRHPVMITSVIPLSIGVALLAGCGPVDTGPPTTQERAIEAVGAVELDTSGELIVTRGDRAALTVTAGEKVIDRLTSEVDDDVLRLGIDGEQLARGGDIRYELTLPALDTIAVQGSGEADVDFTGASAPVMLVKGSGSVRASGVIGDVATIALDGSGSIAMEDIDVRELATKIDGAGEVTASGTVVAQDVEIRGSGEYKAHDLQSTDARAMVRGSGAADVLVSGTLDATIDGSGEIRHSGDPEVTEKVFGSGEVIPR